MIDRKGSKGSWAGWIREDITVMGPLVGMVMKLDYN
jgi:hypothetical protein